MFIQRTIQDDILHRIKDTEVDRKIIVIYGARQVGKTTMVKEILSRTNLKAEYFNCDYLDIQSTFAYENAGSLESVVKNLDLIVLDEAQRIRNIGLTLKILYDEFPHLRIIATGSSSFDLSNQISEPLTGRKTTFILYPFSYPELASNKNMIHARREVNRILRFGSYPSVILNDDKLAIENLNEITSSYIFKDILEYQHLKKPEIILQLLKMLAFQISNEVSYTELAGRLKVDQTVVQRYIQLLEDSFIIFRLPALKKNLRNEVSKSRKIYFWDIGIRNMLIQQINTLDFRNDIGAIWENFCIAERLKFLSYNPPLLSKSYFWRTYNQKEIDYIEEHNLHLKAWEFKWSAKKIAVAPKDFTQAYPESSFQVVTPDNFDKKLFIK